MMFIRYCSITLGLLFAIGCARLDDNLFNPSRLDSYQLDQYEQETDFRLDDNYLIKEEFIHHIENEISSTVGNSTVDVHALFIGEKDRIGDEDYKIILYCHGNRDHMDFYWPRTKLLANSAGNQDGRPAIGVLTLDYRGYGMTDGNPSEEGLYADVAATIAWLEQQATNVGKTMKSENFFIYGFSMGTAPAVELSANPRTDLVASKIILEAPFASAEVMIQDNTLLALPDSFFTNLKIDNANEIKKLREVPLLWIHGKQDDFLSISSHGEVVFKNHPGTENEDKFAYRVENANHSNIPQMFGDQPYVDYSEAIFAFINGE